MRLILLLFFLYFLVFPDFVKAQNEIPTVNENEFTKNQINKSSLRKIKFIENIGLFKLSDTLIGAVNKKGAIAIPAMYKNISSSNGVYVLQKFNNKYHFYINPNKLLSSFDCDSFSIHQNLILFTINEKWGAYILKKNGVQEVKPQYKSIKPINGTLLLTEYNRWQLRNKDTSYCCISADTIYFKDKTILYKRNNLIGILSETGKELTEVKYITIDKSDVEINNDSTIQSKLNSNSLSNTNEKLFDSSLVALADTLKYFTLFKRVDSNLIIVGRNEEFGVFNTSKKQFIISVDHNVIYPEIKDQIFLIYDTTKFSIVDFDGYVLSEPHQRFDTVFEFHEGRAKFIKAGKFGFIDRRGNIRVAPQYKTLRDFHSGAAAVFLNGKWGFIDNDEAILVQPLYDEVIDFQNNIGAVRKGKFWFFVKKDGNESSNLKYDSVRYSGYNYWFVFKDKKIGLVDGNGREKLGPRYEDLHVCNKLVAVKKFSKWGIVDMQENSIVPLEYDIINCNENSITIKMNSSLKVEEIKYGN